MKLSIIIPVYNVEKYLEKCIMSAIDQTLHEIEIIAVNDGSTDSCLEILKRYELNYPHLIKVINQKNKGLSGARNSGLKIAKGEYVYFLDSDDYIDIESMEYCYKICKKYKLDIITFDAKCFLDDDSSMIEDKGTIFDEDYKRDSLLVSERLYTGEEFYIECIDKKAYKQPIWLFVYRKDFLIDNNLFFKEGLIHEDELYTPIAITTAERIMYISKEFFFRRIRFNSIMSSKVDLKKLNSLNLIANELYTYQKHYKGDELVKQYMKKQIRDLFSAALYKNSKRDANKKEKLEFKQTINKSIENMDDIINLKLNIQRRYPNLYSLIFDIKKHTK